MNSIFHSLRKYKRCGIVMIRCTKRNIALLQVQKDIRQWICSLVRNIENHDFGYKELITDVENLEITVLETSHSFDFVKSQYFYWFKKVHDQGIMLINKSRPAPYIFEIVTSYDFNAKLVMEVQLRKSWVRDNVKNITIGICNNKQEAEQYIQWFRQFHDQPVPFSIYNETTKHYCIERDSRLENIFDMAF